MILYAYRLKRLRHSCRHGVVFVLLLCKGAISIMKLYIARHGQTDWNVERRMQGRSGANIPLNNIGIEQAKALRDKTKRLNLDICYVSPLRRATETARIVVGDKCEIIYDDRLAQRSFGNYDGRIVQDWVKTTGIDIGSLQLNTGAGNIEPVKDVLERTKKFLDSLKERHAEMEKILVITHGQIVRALHYNIMGYTDDINWWEVEYGNAEVREYELLKNS